MKYKKRPPLAVAADVLEAHSEKAVLKLTNGPEGVAVTVTYSKAPDKKSIQLFASLVGEERFLRICRRPEIKLDPYKLLTGLQPLTKSIVRRFFVGMADIRLEDFEDPSTPEKIEAEYTSLFPFHHFSQVFLGKIPTINLHDLSWSSGKGFEGLKERVYMIHHDRLQLTQKEWSSEESFVHRAEMLAARVADRELPVGTLLRLPEGYRFVERIFSGDGAYIFVLTHVHEPELHPPLFVCRGTAPRFNATSGFASVLNDLLVEIGVLGIQHVWDDILQYITERNIKSVELLGRSLGGGHAQILVPLFEGIARIKVEKLTTVGSIGVHDSVHEVFHEVRRELKIKEPLSIHVIRSGGEDKHHQVDYIPLVGGKMLGALHPEHTARLVSYVGRAAGPLHGVPEETPFIRKAGLFFKSFAKAHIFQATLQDFSLRHIDCPEKTLQELLQTEDSEHIRQWVATAIDRVTFGQLNKQPFRSFYDDQLIYSERK